MRLHNERLKELSVARTCSNTQPPRTSVAAICDRVIPALLLESWTDCRAIGAMTLINITITVSSATIP